LDSVLGGGFLREGFYLLQGDPGAGKTTLALQFLLRCGRIEDKALGLYITMTESLHDLERTAAAHHWSLDTIRVYDLSRADANLNAETQYTVFFASEVELGHTIQAILAEVERVKPRYVVFDGLAELRLLAGDPLRYRRQMMALKHFFEDNGITVLLLDDRTSQFANNQPQSLVSGSLVMENTLPGYGGVRRRIHVQKVRGADFRGGYHDYDITDRGVVVYPRLIAADHRERFQEELFSSGVAGLDSMLNGGLAAGTTTLLLGPAGVGKSTVSMQYAVTALQHGHKAAVYSFDEVLATLIQRTSALCHTDIHRFLENKQLHLQQVDPAELSPGAFAREIQRVVEIEGTRVLVIDSLNGYLNAMPDERFLQTHLHELFSYLNQQGVVTLVTVGQHGLVTTSAAELNVSYLSDNVLVMRYFEVDGEIRQAISVFKKRNGPHERTLRELQFSWDNLAVGEPIRGLQGVMTGIPHYGPSNTSSVAGQGHSHDQ
jgi:circadian clock protein KaiC